MKPPWEVDGRRWHTRDRVGPQRPTRPLGRPDPRAASSTPIHGLGDVRPDRLVAAVGRQGRRRRPRAPPLLHGDDRPRVGRDPPVPRPAEHVQAARRWRRSSGSRPFHEATTPVLSDAPRVSLSNVPGGVQEVVITASADDLDTAAFDAFLARAVAAYGREGGAGGG